MTKRTRRVLFWLAVAVFVAATPLIVSYARGYRLDLSGLDLSRVGAIALETKPKEATVWLNNKKLSKSTPTVIRNLFPEKNYELRIEREGFWPWEKELEVEPELVTAVRNIVLFPLELKLAPAVSEAPVFNNFFLSPNAERVLGRETGGNVSLGTRLFFGDGLLASEVKNVHWSENGGRVVFNRVTYLGERWYVADTDGKLTYLNGLYETELRINQPATKPLPRRFAAEEVLFSDAAGSKIIALIEGRLFTLNLGEETISELAVENVKAINLNSGRLVIFKNPDIILVSKSSGEDLTLLGNFRFAPNNILISPDGKKAAFWHNWHIGVFWLEDSADDGLFRKRGEQDIVFPSLSPIKRVRWHSSSQYLMAFLENGEFTVAELDGRGGSHNAWTWDLPEITAFDYAAAKEELWFLDSSGALLRHAEKF